MRSHTGTEFVIREAGSNDIDGIFDVRTSVRDNHMTLEELAVEGITPEALPEMLTGSGRGWVAELSGEIAAFAMADAEDATVFALFVRPEHEGLGLGKLLLTAAEHWLATQGNAEVWLVTDRDRSVRANGFYRYLGWIDDGVQEDGQVRFVKTLKANA